MLKWFLFLTLNVSLNVLAILTKGRLHQISGSPYTRSVHNIAILNNNRIKRREHSFIQPCNINTFRRGFPINTASTPPSDGPSNKLTFPFDQKAPLSNYPLPPWAVELIGDNKPKEDYIPRHYSQKEILEGIGKYNEETRKQSVVKHITESEVRQLSEQVYHISSSESCKDEVEDDICYGFKFKQIQPIRHHNGKAFTFFYVHSLHTDVIPVLLNSLRRVAKRNLGAGRITAIRIPGMENEFCSVVGLREDYFDLIRNLRGVIFRNVPESATFTNPIIGRLRIKGPIISVAGHIQFDVGEDRTSRFGSSSGSRNDRKIEIVNKNHYICTLSPDSYLTMDVKIEYISNCVETEHGPESLNRDITEDGFIHFSTRCLPVQVFAFSGERRGMDEESTSEIVTLELHTDGSMTPKLALLKTATILLNWFERTLEGLRDDFSPDYIAIERAKRGVGKAELMHPEFIRNLPWNPYLLPKDRVAARQRWFYRKDVRRQYAIDPESRMAKEEQLAEWEDVLDDQILFEKHASKICNDDVDDRQPPIVDNLDPKEQEEYNKEINPPTWVFKDPTGPGYFSQKYVADFDDDQPSIIPRTDKFH